MKAQNSFGNACNFSISTSDTIQCPTNLPTVNLYCACNNTCAYVQNSVISGGCNDWTYVNYAALLISGGNTASTADAEFGGNQAHLADYYCCQGCGGSQQSLFATATGVTIDCASLSISKQQICDNTYQNVPYLQNCAKYVGAQGGASMAVASVSITAILALATLLLS